MKHLAKFLKNRIWFIAAAVLLVLLAVQGCGKLYEPAMALEQLARCGETEHVHTEECYMDELLICGTRAHTHGENCYIFRVDENDLNAILTDMGEKEIYSLEDYMAHTLSSVYGEGVSLDDILRHTSVEELNAAIAASGDSKLRFNAAMDLPATYAVGGTPGTQNHANFYIYLDEKEFVYIGNVTVTDNNSNDYALKSDIVALFNTDEIVSNIVANNLETGSSPNNGVQIRYTTSVPNKNTNANSFNTNGNYTFNYSNFNDTSRISFGNAVYYGNSYPRYATLMTSESTSTSGAKYNPINFYTVTLDYSGADATKANDVQYVQSGVASSLTLSEEYQWVDEKGDVVTSLPDTIEAKTTLYAKLPPKDCTVTYKDVNDNTVRESEQVASGSSVTLPYGYKWRDGAGNSYDGGASVKITGDTNFVGTPIYTVTFVSNGGSEVAPQNVEHGKTVSVPAEPKRDSHSFGGWYTDAACTHAYDFDTEVTGNLTLYAKWTVNKYTITFKNGKTGEPLEKRTDVSHGSTITLPEAVGGTYWQLEGGGVYSPGDKITVTGNMTFTSTDKVTATFVYKNGNVSTSAPVTPGESVPFPAVSSPGNVWVIEGGNGDRYYGEQSYPITDNTTFVESSVLTVTYNVNFPTGVKSDGSYYYKEGRVTIPKSPTLAGTEVATISDTITEGINASIRNITETLVRADVPTHQSNFEYVFYFSGWKAADGTMIPAGSTLSTAALESHANENGEVVLTGVWDYGVERVANFCINYASKLVSGGTADLYTKSLYSTYVGGTVQNNGYTVAKANTASEILGVDSAIRARYGAHDQDVWLYSLPSDDLIFAGLVEELGANKVLTVEDETVLAKNLTSEYYTIRWTAFFYENWGGWHIDGVLVKKEGQIYVDKVFGGIDEAVKAAKKDFYILAENGTYDEATDTFTPYERTDSAYNAHVLVLDDTTITNLRNTYPNATFQTYNTQDINADGEIDKWLITNVQLGEHWRFTEHAAHPSYTDPSGTEKKYSWYAEYTITDTDGEHSAIAEFGSTAQVLGKTYALDENPDQGLSVKFTNYYYSSDSVLVRKIDSDTGEPLGGASFELWQRTGQDEETYNNVKLRFSDDGNGIYTLSDNGEMTTITTNAQGFSVITITGFSFEAGPLTVKEVVPPSGYDLVNPVTVHYLNGVDGDVGITDIENIDPARFSEFAEYNYDDNTQGGVIVVKDHTSHEATVTAKKIWENPNFTADSVTVVLLATVNGVTQNAGALFPNLTGHQVVLNEANNWTHTWTGLSAYANGELVQWSIKEIKVGSDTTLSDGVSFASWIASYSPVSSWDSNGDGVTDSWSATVTNSQKRPMVNVYKVDSKTNAVLEGATFTLEKVQWSGGQWQQVPGTFTLTQTTDENGWLLFDNLTPSSSGSTTFYRLTETSPPMGYTKLADSVVFTIDGFGNIYEATEDGNAGSTVLDTDYVDFYSRYYITVLNEAMPQFPETGGEGTDVYARLGVLLALAAAAAVIYKTKRRKEGDASAV